MANEQLIRQIVDTYDLDSRIKERIIQIALNNTNDLFLDGFDNIYTYVAELIENFEIAHGARAFKSLDSKISHNSEDTFGSLLGVRDKTLESLFEEQEEQQKLSAEEVLDILKRKIDQSYFSALQHLLSHENNEILLNVSPNEIEDNIEEIQHKLEELIWKYEQKGRLVLPQRTIIQVKFDPLQIKFGNRFYNGNPLAFFQEHQEHYSGLGRGELSLVDPGIYASLLRYGQLDEAIPLKNRTHSLPLTSEQINKIIENHPVYKGSPYEAARHLPHDRATIIKYWKKAGLEIKLREGRRKPLSHDKREEIVSIFLDVKNIKEVERRTGHSRNTILKYLEEAGIDVKQYHQHKHYPVKNLGYRPGGFRGYSNPIEYFRANLEEYNGLGRTELFRRDPHLYQFLLKAHQMDEVIPLSKIRRKKRKYHGNPLAYFRENEEIYKGMTRGQLRNFDQGFWVSLRNANQLDQAIPKTAFRGYSTPLDYVHANSEQYKNLTKTQLKEKDRELYRALRRLDQLDEVVSPSTLLYRGHKTPLDYFRAHFQKYLGITRGQLSLADPGLYRSLIRHEQLDEAMPLQAISVQRD